MSIGRNGRGQVTIDGVARFPRLIYDAGFAGSGGTDMLGHVDARNLARFKDQIDFYLNYQTGTLDNGDRLCDALLPLRMYPLATGNKTDLDIWLNPTYNGVPFRTSFCAKSNAGPIYIADEPAFTDVSRDTVVNRYNTYQAAMPQMPQMTVFLNDAVYQYVAWADYAIGDWIGSDIYPIGTASEQNPGSPSPPAVSSYGYMNFTVGEAAALARYHALRKGRVPLIIFQFLKFGASSRFITYSENWSHVCAGLAEMRGVGVFGWWAMGVGNGALDTTSFTASQRNDFLNRLDDMTQVLAALEPIMVQPDNPALIVNNSLNYSTPLAWRTALANVLRNGGGDRPCWLWGAVQRYSDEYTRLNLPTPDTTLSDHMLDQKADVRTASWEVGQTGLVAAYNMQPDPRTATLTWHRPVARVEVINERRDVAVNADGLSWTDTYGGASSLRQGPSNQGHLYRLTLADRRVRRARA